MEQIEEAHLPVDVEAIVAVEPALDPSPAAPSQPTQPTPIWHGAYAGPGEDVGLSSLPDELLTTGLLSDQPGLDVGGEPVTPDMPVVPMTALMTPVVVEAVTGGTAEKPETIVDAGPLAAMPTFEDRMVMVAPESPPDTIELALSVECVSPLVEAAAPAGTRDSEVPTARLVPVLTPGTYGALDAFADVPGVETSSTDSVVDVEPASETPTTGARLVPVLTPGTTDSSTERTDTMLRAIVLDGGLGAFGAASGPTVPLPGREVKRAALTMAAPEEEQPRAG
jgi:hypothetical protein